MTDFSLRFLNRDLIPLSQVLSKDCKCDPPCRWTFSQQAIREYRERYGSNKIIWNNVPTPLIPPGRGDNVYRDLLDTTRFARPKSEPLLYVLMKKAGWFEKPEFIQLASSSGQDTGGQRNCQNSTCHRFMNAQCTSLRCKKCCTLTTCKAHKPEKKKANTPSSASSQAPIENSSPLPILPKIYSLTDPTNQLSMTQPSLELLSQISSESESFSQSTMPTIQHNTDPENQVQLFPALSAQYFYEHCYVPASMVPILQPTLIHAYTPSQPTAQTITSTHLGNTCPVSITQLTPQPH
eukprot:TRINITY_DN18869_c0_g1::TRINITY_DN18869_c0_g1_i1::g.1538::m.1538 TRINITY_DN18869_c0_g1::TRINITY_DN18869_c0_g1_i1::g.1538  ORF type:complete len:294 (+),score=-19.91,Apc1/PF12859.2/0.14,Apc1/PF12859.2/1.2e+03 TRINITY_DN18869_c0_g1_i1:755-1636(+)